MSERVGNAPRWPEKIATKGNSDVMRPQCGCETPKKPKRIAASFQNLAGKRGYNSNPVDQQESAKPLISSFHNYSKCAIAVGRRILNCC